MSQKPVVLLVPPSDATGELARSIAPANIDLVLAQPGTDSFQAALPNARLEIVKGSGHAVEMEKPDELAKLVTPFLDAQ